MAITALPTPPSRQDPTNFAIRADSFLTALPIFGAEANALAEEVNTKLASVNSSATSAASSATAAASSATSAASSATAAASSATSAANTLDAFDDRYLGSKSTNPTLDNDGQALLTGAMHWNTNADEMRVWTGSSWVPVQTTTASTNAANSATSAAQSATSANSSATSAQAAAAAALERATSAADSYDAFDDRYLGSKSTNPTLDNDGLTLLVGAMHWNTNANEMRVWTGSSWVPVQTTTASTNAANSATSAASSATAAASSATSASTSATNAASSATSASTSATNAANSATAAASSATSASTSASNAATSSSSAASFANTANTAATSANTSASTATTAANTCVTTLADFRDRYLGSRDTNPTTGTSGVALQKGMIYYNTVSNETRVYNGTAWVAAAAPITNIQVTPTNSGQNSSLLYPLLADNYGTSTNTIVHANVLTYNGTTGTLNSTHFNNLSDISLKKDVADITSGISILQTLAPKSFTWKSSGIKDYGLIAQDVEKVLPELVETSDNGIKSVSYISLISLLINAVVELDKEVKQLKSMQQ